MKVLLIFAHPDDETFGCGGTIAKLAKKGVTIKLITATHGEAGQLGDPPVATHAQLAEVREQELRCAAKILGISQIYFLDFIDGTLDKVQSRKLENKILPIIKDEKPDIIITFDKFGVSNHPDHKKIYRVTVDAFKKYYIEAKKHVRLYSVTVPRSHVRKYEQEGLDTKTFGGMRGTAEKDITTISDIKDTFETKVEAFKCHKTQHLDWERILKRGAHIDLTKEYFRLVLENEIV